MYCLVKYFGLGLCRQIRPPIQHSGFFASVIRWLFCPCPIRVIRHIPLAPAVIVQIFEKFAKGKKKSDRAQGKAKRVEKQRFSVKIQAVARTFLAVRRLQQSKRFDTLVKLIGPYVLHRVIKRRVTEKRNIAANTLRQDRQSLSSLLAAMLAVRRGNLVRMQFQQVQTDRVRFVTSIQSCARMILARRRANTLRREKAQFLRTVRPFTTSQLARNFRFRRDAVKTLAGKVQLSPGDKKHFIQSKFLSFAGAVPQLSQFMFEKNYPNLNEARGVFVPIVHIVDSITGFYIPKGLYKLDIMDGGSIRPIAFTGVWSGEVLVWVNISHQPPRAQHPSVKISRPEISTAFKSPVVSLATVMQSEINYQESDSTAGMNIRAKEFSPTIRKPTLAFGAITVSDYMEGDFAPFFSVTTPAPLKQPSSVSPPNPLVEAPLAVGHDPMSTSLSNIKSKDYLSIKITQVGRLASGDECRTCSRCDLLFSERKIWQIENHDVCSNCVTEVKQGAHRLSQLAVNGSIGAVTVKCSCWRTHYWCDKHQHRSGALNPFTNKPQCVCPKPTTV